MTDPRICIADVSAAVASTVGAAWSAAGYDADTIARLNANLKLELDKVFPPSASASGTATTYVADDDFAKSDAKFQAQLTACTPLFEPTTALEESHAQDSTNPRMNFILKCATCGKTMRPSADATLQWKCKQHDRLHTKLGSQAVTAVKVAVQDTYGSCSNDEYRRAMECGVSALTADGSCVAQLKAYQFSDAEINVLRVLAVRQLAQCGGCDCVKNSFRAMPVTHEGLAV